ncbi:MAG: DoxX family protein [Armatimonadetes bacterium]|nr:DoxX family protein [Armatimonadota bacterium]
MTPVDATRTDSRLSQADVAALILRLVLGITFFMHGAQKVLGWFGGNGLAGTAEFMGGMGIPAILAYVVAFTEFFGGIAVLLGLLTRLAALGITFVMLGAIFMVHLKNGFFASNQGFEFPFVLLGIALALVAYGAGRWSLDYLLASRSRSETAVGGTPVTT